MRAYLDFRHSDEEADHFNKIGFGAKITNAYELENGFIIVVVEWNSKIDSHKIKYAKQGCSTSSSTKQVGVELQFPDFPFRDETIHSVFYPGFEVMLDYKDFDKKIEYVCFHNYKYEAVVYFAPEGWNDNKNCKKIDF